MSNTAALVQSRIWNSFLITLRFKIQLVVYLKHYKLFLFFYYGIHVIIYYNQHMHHLLRYSFCQGTEPGGELKKSLKPSLIISTIFCRYYLFLTVLKASDLYLFRYHLSMLQEQHFFCILIFCISTTRWTVLSLIPWKLRFK